MSVTVKPPYVGPVVRYAASVADATSSQFRKNDGDTIVTQGRTSPDDAGSNVFRYRQTGRSLITTDPSFRIAGTGADDYLEAIDQSIVDVTKFGADATGATDSYTAFRAAIDYALDNGADGIFVPMANRQRYLIRTPLQIDHNGFSIVGDAPYTKPDTVQQSAYIFTDQVGQDCIFEFDGIEKTGGWRVSGLIFWQPDKTYATNAIRVTCNNNGPHRPFLFSQNVFTYFTNAIYMEAPSFELVAGDVTIRDNSFVFNDYAVRSPDRIRGFFFDNNISEAGGRIDVFVDSGVSICKNQLEGQSDPIKLKMGPGGVRIDGNYFEANTGVLIDFINASTQIDLEYGFNHNFPAINPNLTDHLLISGCNYHHDSEQITSDLVTIKTGGLIYENSDLGGGDYKLQADSNGDWCITTFDAKQYLNNQISPDWMQRDARNGEVIPYPDGFGKAVFRPSGTQQFTPTGLSFSAGDIIVASVMVRYTDTDDPGSATLEFTDGADTVGGTYILTNKVGKGKWYLVTLAAKLTFSGTTGNLNFSPYTGSGDGAYTGGACIKILPSSTRPVIRPMYPFPTEKTLNEGLGKVGLVSQNKLRTTLASEYGSTNLTLNEEDPPKLLSADDHLGRTGVAIRMIPDETTLQDYRCFYTANSDVADGDYLQLYAKKFSPVGITIGGTFAENDTVRLTIGTEYVEHTVTAIDTNTTIAEALVTLAENSVAVEFTQFVSWSSTDATISAVTANDDSVTVIGSVVSSAGTVEVSGNGNYASGTSTKIGFQFGTTSATSSGWFDLDTLEHREFNGLSDWIGYESLGSGWYRAVWRINNSDPSLRLFPGAESESTPANAIDGIDVLAVMGDSPNVFPQANVVSTSQDSVPRLMLRETLDPTIDPSAGTGLIYQSDGTTGTAGDIVVSVNDGSSVRQKTLLPFSPAALTAADAGAIDSGDATTDAVITANRTRIAELEAALQAAGLIS
jgi:hypothetical protein